MPADTVPTATELRERAEALLLEQVPGRLTPAEMMWSAIDHLGETVDRLRNADPRPALTLIHGGRDDA